MKDFVSKFMRDNSSFPFLCHLFQVFSIVLMIALHSVSFYFLDETVETWYQFLLKSLVEFISKTVETWCLLFGKVIKGYIIYVIDTDLLTLSISSCVGLSKCDFQGTGLFHLGWQTCGRGLSFSVPLLLVSLPWICAEALLTTFDFSFFLSSPQPLSLLLLLVICLLSV